MSTATAMATAPLRKSRFRMNNEKLIREIRERPALWDKTTAESTELAIREKLWDGVAAQLGGTPNAVKARWKNLRDAYRKVVRKLFATGIEPRWPYFEDMEFLRDIVLKTPARTSDLSLIGKIEEVDCSSTNSNQDQLFVPARKTKKRSLQDEPARAEPLPTNSSDDDHQFLMSLYPHFKRVPQSRKLPLRIKIEQAISEELYGTGDSSDQ